MYSEIHSCRSCGSSKIENAFSLGEMALTGRFPAAEEEAVPAGPLDLVMCMDCSLVQLRHNFDLDALYCHDYGYRSSLNETMSAHLAELVSETVSRVDLVPGDTVLDIGSNDATLLKSYMIEPLSRWGMDPTIGQFQSFYPPEIATLAQVFDADVFLENSKSKAKVITSIAMFYDLIDPNAFVADIARSLEFGGMWVLEQSYLPKMIEQNSFDTICHEHLEYFSLIALCDLIDRHDLKVFDIHLNQVNGGSIRLYVSQKNAGYDIHPAVASQIEKERAEGYHGLEPLRALETASHALRNDLVALLQQIRQDGKSVFLYGASTKGNTLLQYCGIDQSIVTAAAERNPEKWGKRTPATNIPIISEDAARKQRPDYFLVLPWHFKEAFVKREAEFLTNGGRMIFPLPELHIV